MILKLTYKGIALGGTTFIYKVKHFSLSNGKLTMITEDDEIHSTWLKFLDSFKIEENI